MVGSRPMSADLEIWKEGTLDFPLHFRIPSPSLSEAENCSQARGGRGLM